MQDFESCRNIKIDGDEFTSGFLGLHWFPSAGSSANQQHYTNDVNAALKRLMQTFAGWAAINEVYYLSPHIMTIRPYHPSATLGTFNATATATDLSAATMTGTVALDGRGNLPAAGKPHVIGTGLGSDTIINFSPSIFAMAGSPTGPGASSDEILLHEMVHGLRQMMGRSVRETVGGNPGMHNYEEFVAIVVANIYRSEIGQPQLRSDHQGFTPLTGPTTSSATFKSTFSLYLGYMDIEMPRLCQNLRQAKGSFNPLN